MTCGPKDLASGSGTIKESESKQKVVEKRKIAIATEKEECRQPNKETPTEKGGEKTFVSLKVIPTFI